MFDLGDRVKVRGNVGKIIGWHFDEGDVWHVQIDDEVYECYNDEMGLA